MQFNSATFLKYTLKQIQIHWVAASRATRTREGQSTVGWCSSTRLFGQLHAVNVNSVTKCQQELHHDGEHTFYMNKITSTGSEHPQCCLELLGLQMKCYSSRPGEMNEPCVTGYMHYSDCNCSSVGTVAAVAALAATLFRPKINIHNLL